MTMQLVSDLRGAIERSELVAYYQPQVEINTLEIVAVEALARWMHSEFGLVVPSLFIPIAEAHGLIDDIGNFMIDAATEHAAGWRDDGYSVEVAVNVSAAQLNTAAFLDRLQRNLNEFSLSPSQITIEITESLPVMDVRRASAQLLKLKEQGIGISIDDFGTGYSALTQLVGIPATELKIDKSIIQDRDSPIDLLKSVVATAHDQGLRVVAEGVEIQDHLRVAREIGSDRAQGYLFGRAMPHHVITPLLEPGGRDWRSPRSDLRPLT